MKICLVTSPHVRHPAVLQSDFAVGPSVMTKFVPLGLLSLISALRTNNGVRANWFDLNRHIIDGTIQRDRHFYASAAQAICSQPLDVVGFMTDSESYHHVLQICRAIRDNDQRILILLGGPHASAVARQTIERCAFIDIVVRGEGELTFVELIDDVMRGGRGSVPGTVYRSGDASVEAPARKQVDCLDDLAAPAYELYQPDPDEEIFVEAGRGCPFQCTFCSTAPFWRRQHRVKSPERLVSDVAHVLSLYGERRIHFTHDLFTTNNRWVHSLCDALIAKGAPVRWTCSSRTDTVDRKLLRHMADAGCDSIYFGLESGSERMLRSIHKYIPLDSSFAVLRDCLDVGIKANAGFIGGLPGEEETSLRETFEAYERALRMGCAPVSIFVFTPYADSPLGHAAFERRYTGHFLDLPLPSETETENRRLIGSDVELFEVYHRPAVVVEPELLDGLEEFPTLVTAMLVPTLVLAQQYGNIFTLYRRWLSWIQSYNDRRGASRHRRFYGSPALFSEFLLDLEFAADERIPGLRSLLEVMRLNHVVLGARAVPTSMATFRSGLASATLPQFAPSTRLCANGVLATLSAPEDIRPLMAAVPGARLPLPLPGPLHLVWQEDASEGVRLLAVDSFTLTAVEGVREKSCTAGDLVEEWLNVSGGVSGGSADVSSLFRRLEMAATEGLINTVADPRVS